MDLTKVANAAFEQYEQSSEEPGGWKPMHGGMATAASVISSAIPGMPIVGTLATNYMGDTARTEAAKHGVKLNGFANRHPGWTHIGTTAGGGGLGATLGRMVSGPTGAAIGGTLGGLAGAGYAGYVVTR